MQHFEIIFSIFFHSNVGDKNRRVAQISEFGNKGQEVIEMTPLLCVYLKLDRSSMPNKISNSLFIEFQKRTYNSLLSVPKIAKESKVFEKSKTILPCPFIF